MINPAWNKLFLNVDCIFSKNRRITNFVLRRSYKYFSRIENKTSYEHIAMHSLKTCISILGGKIEDLNGHKWVDGAEG